MPSTPNVCFRGIMSPATAGTRRSLQKHYKTAISRPRHLTDRGTRTHRVALGSYPYATQTAVRRRQQRKAVKLSNRNVAALVRPASKDDVVIWDDDLPGFGIRLRGDNRSFLIQYRVGVQQRRESLGDIRKVKLEDARKAARQRFAQAQLGQDPAAERIAAKLKAAAKRLTLGVVAERYLEAKKARLRPTSYADARRYFTRHWASLRDWPIAVIQRANVAAGLQDIIKAHGPVSAARARANLSALFTWAIGEGLVEINPVIGTNNPEGGHQARTRVL